MAVIGFIGSMGSGKDTAADYFVNHHGYRRDSFANTLKDLVSSVFGWDRILLEGRTAESRKWREQIDPWWAERLGMPHLTPRWVLQYWGTEVCRYGFHDDIWIASLENKMRQIGDNIVISDVRFPNEIASIRKNGGIVLRIKRGPDPIWFPEAIKANAGDAIALEFLASSNIHSSETAWIGCPVDHTITNDSTIDELFSNLQILLNTST